MAFSPRAYKIWSVYVMATKAVREVTYFKIGMSSDIAKRLVALQTSCPLDIVKVWAITTIDNGSAQILERALHNRLAEYQTIGEWFAMRTADPADKRAMNDAFAYGVEFCSQGPPVKWRAVDVPELKIAVREHRAEQVSKAKTVRTIENKKALLQMVTQKRRIL